MSQVQQEQVSGWQPGYGSEAQAKTLPFLSSVAPEFQGRGCYIPMDGVPPSFSLPLSAAES